MNILNTPISSLSRRPVRTKKFTGLMEITNPNTGFATPFSYVANKRHENENCIAGIIEYNGVITGVYFNGSEWVQTVIEEENVDAYFNNKHVTDKVNKEIKHEAHSNTPWQVEDYKQGNIGYTPPGYHAKVALRHTPLVQEDVDYVLKNKYVHAMYGLHKLNGVKQNPSDQNPYVSIVVIEETGESMYNHVFLYYNPEIKTWRIHDSTRGKQPGDVIDVFEAEIKQRLNGFYDSITEPDEGILQESTQQNENTSINVKPI